MRAARALGLTLVLLAAACGAAAGDAATSATARDARPRLGAEPRPRRHLLGDGQGVLRPKRAHRDPAAAVGRLRRAHAGRRRPGGRRRVVRARALLRPGAPRARSSPSRRSCPPRWRRSSRRDRAGSTRRPTCAARRSASTAPRARPPSSTRVLASAGLGAGDVHIVDVKFNQVPALLGGKVDAVAGVFQNIEGVLFTMRGLHPVVFPYDRYGVPAYDELVRGRQRRPAARRRRLSQDGARVRRRPDRRHRLGQGPSRRRGDRHAPPLRRRLPKRPRAERPRNPAPAGHRAAPEAAWDRFGAWMFSSGLLDERPDAAALIARP